MSCLKRCAGWGLTRLGAIAAIAVVLAGTAEAQAPPGYLAVLHGNTPTVFLQNPADGTVIGNWTLGGSVPRKLALQHDDTGSVTHILIGRAGDAQYHVPAAITRLNVTTGVHDTLIELPDFILSAIAIGTDGRVLYAGRSTSDGGCVYRLSADLASAAVVTCLQAGRTPAALARAADGSVLVGWNDDAVDSLTNYGNGLLTLDPATGTTSPLNEVTGAGTPRLADVAVAPGGRIYIAASPTDNSTGGSISWIHPSAPGTRTVLISGQMGSIGWGIVVRPAQLAVVGTAELHTIYAADPWGVAGGGMGGPGGLAPFNGGLAAISSTGTYASRVSGYGTGPYGVAATGASVAVAPTDPGSGSQPATLTFETLTAAGETTMAISDTGPDPMAGFSIGSPARYYHLSTTASYSGLVTLCLSFAGVSYADISSLEIHHWNGSAWESLPDRFLNADRQTICGRTATLSPFVVAEFVPTDTEPPMIDVTTSTTLLWPPNGTTVPVMVTGVVADESGPVSITIEVVDEYGLLNRAPAAATLPFTVPLEATRRGGDRDGRRYQIILTAVDRYGNTARRVIGVLVPHDRR